MAEIVDREVEEALRRFEAVGTPTPDRRRTLERLAVAVAAGVLGPPLDRARGSDEGRNTGRDEGRVSGRDDERAVAVLESLFES